MEYIEPYIHSPQVRVFTGFKYHAITNKGNEKLYYNRQKASQRVLEHAQNFLYNVEQKGEKIAPLLDRDPFYNIAFDAELFGHWWFEGIQWLEAVLRGAAKSGNIVFETNLDYLDRHKEAQVLQPSYSSWGEGGYSNVWADGTNVWVYRHIHKSIERMEELAVRFPNQNSLKQRFLNQAAREVILSMASDWPFIIHNKTSVTYAQKRLKEHLGNFNLVYENMCKNAVNTEWLVKAEKRNIIFSDIDYNIFNLDCERNRYNG